MEIGLQEIWTAGGVILGFQVASFAQRVAQESKVAKEGDLVWLPPADYFNLSAIFVMVLGVFIAPAAGWFSLEIV